MTNKVSIFENKEFGKVRAVEIDNNPYFVGKDIAKALGYSDINKAIAMHVDNDDKKLNDKSSPSFGQRGATLINEHGLYSLILSSKLPTAKKFKCWVFDEVLPSCHSNSDKVLEVEESDGILTTFNNTEFGQIRMTEIDDIPYFVGKDVAGVLGYERATKAIADHVDEEDRIMIDSKTQSRFGIELGQRGGWFINESGLYSLILSSKLPSAKKFKRWVTSEVLPSIRKHGGYISNQNNLSYDEIMEQVKQYTESLFVEKNKRINDLENKVEEMLPDFEFSQRVLESDDSIDMGTMARLASKGDFNIGRNSLFRFLRERKVLNARNKPYATYMNRGWFEISESVLTMKNGDTKLIATTLVKPKGQVGIVGLLNQRGMSMATVG